MSAVADTSAPTASGRIAEEAARRRTFAIISHPDAGKTTLTEKLLLYGGAVLEAGAVHGKGNRRAATSDWMQLERERGISVSSTVMRFEHGGTAFNLLDTPGHRDFSEDTLRVLAAADAAVMLLDAAKGVEPQTLRLFEVARRRGIPLITFVNKYDRPGMEPLAMLDHVESVLGLAPTAMTWPVGEPGDFSGVIDRRTGAFHRFERSVGGATRAREEILAAGAAATLAGGPAWETAQEELELLDGAGFELDDQTLAGGQATPVFFGSALSNFGVGLLLDALVRLAPAPAPRPTVGGDPRALEAPFSGLVFKVQANMDPRHRDRLAFVRVCSGRFERGMRATNARTGKPFALAHTAELFGQGRETLDEAYPGDVIGVVNAADLRVGDSLYEGEPVEFPAIPTLAPEHFMTVRNRVATKHKQFHRGLAQLAEEGVVHVLRRGTGPDPTPVLGAVGPLQFEVTADRMEREFGVTVGLEPTQWTVARRTTEDAVEALRADRQADVLFGADGVPLALFPSEYQLMRFQRDHPELVLERLLRG